MRSAVLIVLLAAGCADRPAPTKTVHLGSLAFDVEADWNETNQPKRGEQTSMWVPRDNTGSESITVMRVSRPGGAKLSVGELEQQLWISQHSLHDAQIARAAPVTTSRGLARDAEQGHRGV